MNIAFYGMKGGVGKTTLAVTLACTLAKRTKPVLLLDVDRPQYSAAAWSQGTAIEGLIVRAEPDLAEQDKIPPGFAHVIYDCPGRLDESTRSALVKVDVAIVPVSPSGVEQWTLEESLRLAELANEARTKEGKPELRVRLLRTRWRRGPIAAGVEQAHDPALWLRTVVRDLNAFKEAMSAARSITVLAAWREAAADIKALSTEIRGLVHD